VRETRTNVLSYAVPLLAGVRELEGPIGALVRGICDDSRLYDYYSTVENTSTLIINASAFSKASPSSIKLDGGLPQINLLMPELNPSSQRCLPRFLLGILIF
jgi:hypothetical protein